MTFNPQTDFVRCPHCKHMLDKWTLDLWKCPNDNAVFEEASFEPVTELSHSVGQSGGPGHATSVIAADHLPQCRIAGKCD